MLAKWQLLRNQHDCFKSHSCRNVSSCWVYFQWTWFKYAHHPDVLIKAVDPSYFIKIGRINDESMKDAYSFGRCNSDSLPPPNYSTRGLPHGQNISLCISPLPIIPLSTTCYDVTEIYQILTFQQRVNVENSSTL